MEKLEIKVGDILVCKKRKFIGQIMVCAQQTLREDGLINFSFRCEDDSHPNSVKDINRNYEVIGSV